jgi:hypothetical protein
MDRCDGIVTIGFQLGNIDSTDAVCLDRVNVDDEAILCRVSKMGIEATLCRVKRDEIDQAE